MNEPNLDRLCAEYGYTFCDKVYDKLEKDKGKADNHLTKSLGVLQEDGVYAFFLYQLAKESKKGEGRELVKWAAALLVPAQIAPFYDELGKKKLEDAEVELIDPEEVLALVRRAGDGLAANLDNLLLAKRLLEQALIYARYHAKALGEEND